jgi:hypothetical protein
MTHTHSVYLWTGPSHAHTQKNDRRSPREAAQEGDAAGLAQWGATVERVYLLTDIPRYSPYHTHTHTHNLIFTATERVSK